jgi:2',3'-cyclic-nucleotide 2'-phosphodiesterase (5'-nucleotidase family)
MLIRPFILPTALVCAAVSLVACRKTTSTPPPVTEAPRWPACEASATQQKLTFVHVNDLHSNYQLDSEGRSPYALVRGFYERAKEQNPFTLFTSGGDDYEKGSVVEQISKGASTTEILHAMKFDVRVIGNHDYGWDVNTVLQNARDPYSAVLSSNIHYTGNDAGGFAAKDFVTLQVGCVNLGFFGLTSGPWNEKDQSVREDFYPEFPTNLDYVARAKELVAQHRSEVDLLIAVTHIGKGEDEALADQVQGIDVILGGHSHTPMGTPSIRNGTIIIQAGSMAIHASKLELLVDLATKKIASHDYQLRFVLPADEEFAPDAALQKVVNDTITKYAPETRKPAASLKENASRAQIAQLTARLLPSVTDADAAIVDMGMVWGSWTAGKITQQDFLDAYKVEREPPGTPGFNALYTLSITGAELQELRTKAGDGWAFYAPDTIDPSKTYTLALNKRPAFHPTEYLPEGVVVSGTPQFVSESWEALDRIAKLRTKECQYLDSDEKVPGC